jgi:uncharacterized protein YcbX
MKVTNLFIYPIKACRGVRLERARIVARGFAADRRYMLIDAVNEFVTQRKRRELALVSVSLVEGGFELSAPGRAPLHVSEACEVGERVTARVWGHEGVGVRHVSGSAWFSEYLGAKTSLVYMPDDHERPVNPDRALRGDVVSFADGYPLLLTSEESLAELNRRMPSPIGMLRFRPNIVIDGSSPFVEDTFARVRIGGTTFRGPKGCDRCVVTTIDPETAEAHAEPLKTLATFRKWDGKVWFGMNLIHDAPGELSVGDAVTPLE